MSIHTVNSDIKVFCVTADSFPEGILAAHQKLQTMLPVGDGRKFFGISRPGKNGVITYKAAVEESYSGEAEKYGCETFIIRKGDYISEKLINWRNDESNVAKTFQKLLSDPRIKRNGYCLEMYLNDSDMMCMVKLAV